MATMKSGLAPPADVAWPIPAAAVALIAEKEQGPSGGPALRAYKCPAGVWTLGFGETAGIKPGMTCTEAEAWAMLCRDLTARTNAVAALVKTHAEPNQLGAMVSLAYNIGMAAFAKSTVLKAHNAGDFDAAARAFGLWNKATVGGQLQVLRGLTARRAAEAALYLTPEPEAYREPMAQAVAAESKLTASPIAQGGAAVTGLGLLDMASQAGDSLGVMSGVLGKAKGLLLDALGLPPQWLFPAMLILIGVSIGVYRWKQRRGGWA